MTESILAGYFAMFLVGVICGAFAIGLTPFHTPVKEFVDGYLQHRLRKIKDRYEREQRLEGELNETK